MHGINSTPRRVRLQTTIQPMTAQFDVYRNTGKQRITEPHELLSRAWR
jgi:hypothetical protein